MSVLSGLLFINGNDAYDTYGVFFYEDRKGANNNYSALLKPPSMKQHKAVDFREQDGEKLPAQLLPRFEARDVTLQFMILAPSADEFLERYTAFVDMLRSGWLDVRVPEIDRTYKMYYQSCTEYKQLTKFSGSVVAGSFKVKLREPQPTI